MSKKQKLQMSPVSAGYTAEEVKSQFFNEMAILEKPRQIFRLQYEGNRYYYTFGDDGEPRFFISITSLTDKQAPKGSHLIKWMAEKGIEAAEAHRDKRAEYGTFLHICCGELMLNKRFDLDALPIRLEEHFTPLHLPLQWIREFVPELRKDILSFAQFLKDYEVEPIAIEMPLASDMYGCASTIDIVARMNDKCYDKTPPEKRKKVWAIIDIKSGKKGFNEQHEVQLYMGKIAFEENFPTSPRIDKMFNWSPQDWYKYPTYKVKDQTQTKGQKKLEHYLALQAIDEDGQEKLITVTGGKIDLNEDLTANYKSAPYTEIVKAKRPAQPKSKKARVSKRKAAPAVKSEEKKEDSTPSVPKRRGRIKTELSKQLTIDNPQTNGTPESK